MKEGNNMKYATTLMILLLVITMMLVSACDSVDVSRVSDKDIQRIANNVIVCNAPYIRFGSSCCLDQNNNSVCDKDEGLPDTINSSLNQTNMPLQPPEDHEAVPPTQQAQQPATSDVPKSDKPNVELFVMSIDPFGLQMEKAYIPVARLLGSKADMSIKWVDYVMHGQNELQEDLRQYCIEQEQPSKYLDYLTCFVASTDTTSCQQQAGIDTAALQTCYDATDKQYGIMAGYNDQSTWLSGQFPQFNIYKDLNNQYGVQGSPTLVINGKKNARNKV